MTRIQAADAQAMDTLFFETAHASARTAGIVDKDLPMNTETAFKDHESYVQTVEEILSGDDKQSFEPNDPTLD